MRTRPSHRTLLPVATALLGALVALPGEALQGSSFAPVELQPTRTARGKSAPPVNAGPAVEPLPGNVLILLADDLGVDKIGAYQEGADLPSTPHLDALAADGVLFRNAWSNPVCSPTRATIQTGRYSFRTGIGMVVDFDPLALPLDEVTLPEMLDIGTNGGYAHAAIGKWHLGNDDVGGFSAPNVAGYSHFAGTMKNIEHPETYFSYEKVVDGVPMGNRGYATTEAVDDALAWIDSTPEPWFCYLAFHAPHHPFHAPPDELHDVDLSQADPDPNKDPEPYFRAMVEAIDAEVGRMLASLPPDVRARTTVVFLGDNGTPPGATTAPFDSEHAKGTAFEGGVNVPLIVHSPLVAEPGRESLALVNTTDLFATTADIAGVDLDTVMGSTVLDSVSLVPYLEDPAQPDQRPFVFAESFNPNITEPPVWPPPCVTLMEPPFCQTDVGLGGPVGNAVLTMCGDELYGGKTSMLQLVNAPANAFGSVFVSPYYDPIMLFHGMLVPFPVTQQIDFQTDASGSYSLEIVGGVGEETLYYQAVVQVPLQPGVFHFSNALEVAMHDNDVKTVRDGRFKLMLNALTCEEWLYDLSQDPFETVNLLEAGSLSKPAATALTSLRRHLDTLLLGSS